MGKIFDKQLCNYCSGGTSKIFDDGENTLNNFIDYVLASEKNKNIGSVIVIAHNAKSFDCQFILNSIVSNVNIIAEPKLILSGSKIMMLSVGSIKFIDSLNYFNMKLSALPKAFGLKSDVAKGIFPFHFNMTENQSYIGPLPDNEHYEVETMSVSDEQKFDLLYEKMKSADYRFDFKKEMTMYCQMNASILREACLEFRKMFLEIGNVCPFSEAVTLAGACSVIFRKNYFKNNMIGIIPVGGYR